MNKVDRSLGRELRRRRRASGHTLDSLAAELRVADNTIGRWERGEMIPSPSNMRALRRLGLIAGWQSRNGRGSRQGRQVFPPEKKDRVMQTLGYPRKELQVRVQRIENASERELLALYRTFAVDERRTILRIFHLVVAKPGPRRGS